jgi:hypothetical protein
MLTLTDFAGAGVASAATSAAAAENTDSLIVVTPYEIIT